MQDQIRQEGCSGSAEPPYGGGALNNPPNLLGMVSSPSVEKPRASASSSWDALADIEVFITAAEAELVALERARTGVRRRGRKPDPVLRRRLLGVTWMLTFGGMQWRLAGLLIPFTTLHSAFARWTRLGLWR